MTGYFLVWYRLNGLDRYLIWTSDDDGQDRVMLDPGGRLLTFPAPDRAAQYASAQGWSLESEYPLLHDFDAVRAWLEHPDPDEVDCSGFLDAWNLFTDVAMSISGQDFVPRTDLNDGVYDTLFWGCNLSGLTPPGGHFDPTWPPEDIAELEKTLRAGLRMFVEQVAVSE